MSRRIQKAMEAKVRDIGIEKTKKKRKKRKINKIKGEKIKKRENNRSKEGSGKIQDLG